MIPRTVFGIIVMVTIVGFFIQSFTGEKFETLYFFSDETFSPGEDLDFWDKCGYLIDLVINTVVTIGSSVFSIAEIFEDLPDELQILSVLLLIGLALAIIGKVIK